MAALVALAVVAALSGTFGGWGIFVPAFVLAAAAAGEAVLTRRLRLPLVLVAAALVYALAMLILLAALWEPGD